MWFEFVVCLVGWCVRVVLDYCVGLGFWFSDLVLVGFRFVRGCWFLVWVWVCVTCGSAGFGFALLAVLGLRCGFGV